MIVHDKGNSIVKYVNNTLSNEVCIEIQDPAKYHEAWKILCETDGVIVPGGFGTRGIQGKQEAARWCRTTGSWWHRAFKDPCPIGRNCLCNC